MKKIELVEKLTAKVEGMTKKDAGIVLDAIGEVIAEALVAGDDVTIPSVGKFVTKATSARTARNPQTGESIEVPASRKVAFKVTSALKAEVKEA